MLISRYSWHYKFNNWFSKHIVGDIHPKESTNLCRYFWRTVRNLIVTTAILSFIVFCLAGITIFVVRYINNLIVLDTAVLIATGIVFLILLIIALGIFIFVKYQDRQDKIEFGEIVPKEPGLVKSFVKAKKSKVCPMIQYIDK